ncbi:MAG TPA: hypothetical protein VN673_02430 [Clostridia bacterium]|nr:hypothetical protein [Clostridia bacterium]
MLKDPAQLPEIRDSAFTLVWDEVGPASNPWTVILHGERIIWTEPAHFECYYRYLAIAPILKQKYGAALKDLVPTLGSQLDLYGDKIASLWWIADCRRDLFGTPDAEGECAGALVIERKLQTALGFESKVERLTKLGVTDRDMLDFAALIDAYDAAITSLSPKRIYRPAGARPEGKPPRDTLASSSNTAKPAGRQVVAALRQIRALVRDTSRADALYEALPGTHHGWLIDPDLARDLFEPHRWGGLWDKFHWSGIIDPVTRQYTKDLLMRAAESYAGPDGRLMLCLGGEAAGKSTILGCLADSGLALPKILEWTPHEEDYWRRPNFGAELIQEALNDWKVHVMYVQRPVEHAMSAIAPRAKGTGWACPLHEVQSSHRKSREILAELYTEFRETPHVSFSAFNNPGTQEEEKLRTVEQITLEDAIRGTGDTRSSTPVIGEDVR